MAGVDGPAAGCKAVYSCSPQTGQLAAAGGSDVERIHVWDLDQEKTAAVVSAFHQCFSVIASL